MENQRPFLFIALLAISAVLYTKWLEFSNPKIETNTPAAVVTNGSVAPSAVPASPTAVDSTALPSTPTPRASAQAVPELAEQKVSRDLVTVTTDLLHIEINLRGGVIERVELLDEPVALDKPDQGFALLKRTAAETYVAEDGLLANAHAAPNHLDTQYVTPRKNYDLANSESISVPLNWVADDGVQYLKTLTFTRDSYLVDISYQVTNASSTPWNGYSYAQFNRTEPQDKGGGFGQLPSYTGGAIYTEAEKFEKIEFSDMTEEPLARDTDNGWVAMLQHYFVAAWIPADTTNKQFFSGVGNRGAKPSYRIGYKTLDPVLVAPGQTGKLSTTAYLGSKEQKRLKRIQKEVGITGLALTVDFGFLTFIADPLFIVLSWIHDVVGNWGWAIIILTILIKLVFYPLSAASYKSMAGMKKLQPRIQTLKERYKDDRQKFQMEMMALYKKEKINPAGGCLPILIQIPVFIALYWALLESVEMRHAPFALWLQDLSAPDPFYILPVLMGVSMWAQQKLNPAPMDDIQKKVMTIMPIALTFLFLTFPQGLVLYWVVNNILSMAQQWFIYKQLGQ